MSNIEKFIIATIDNLEEILKSPLTAEQKSLIAARIPGYLQI